MYIESFGNFLNNTYSKLDSRPFAGFNITDVFVGNISHPRKFLLRQAML